MFVCSYGLKPHIKHTRKGKTHMNENKLLTIYGARLSKSGKHINLTLVEGENEQRKFYTACVKIGEQSKVHGTIDKNVKGEEEAIIVVPLLAPTKTEEAPKDQFDDLDQIDEDQIPF